METLPQTLPIFPLSGVLLLPGGYLPLNIFEDRYKKMVDDVLKTHRTIGMIQPNDSCETGLFGAGCAGKITSFHETEDHRYLITLTGLWRFEIDQELTGARGYRMVQPRHGTYKSYDEEDPSNLDALPWDNMCEQLKSYFEMTGLDCNWKAVLDTPKSRLLTVLSMVCPFDPSEKQALLEAKTEKDRFDLFSRIITMAVEGQTHDQKTKH